MYSTDRNDVKIAVFASRLAKAMEKRSDLSFGDLLYEALEKIGAPNLDVAAKLRMMTDTEIAEAVERFVLME
jgi:hypothetical protein